MAKLGATPSYLATILCKKRISYNKSYQTAYLYRCIPIAVYFSDYCFMIFGMRFYLTFLKFIGAAISIREKLPNVRWQICIDFAWWNIVQRKQPRIAKPRYNEPHYGNRIRGTSSCFWTVKKYEGAPTEASVMKNATPQLSVSRTSVATPPKLSSFEPLDPTSPSPQPHFSRSVPSPDGYFTGTRRQKWRRILSVSRDQKGIQLFYGTK